MECTFDEHVATEKALGRCGDQAGAAWLESAQLKTFPELVRDALPEQDKLNWDLVIQNKNLSQMKLEASKKAAAAQKAAKEAEVKQAAAAATSANTVANTVAPSLREWKATTAAAAACAARSLGAAYVMLAPSTLWPRHAEVAKPSKNAAWPKF